MNSLALPCCCAKWLVAHPQKGYIQCDIYYLTLSPSYCLRDWNLHRRSWVLLGEEVFLPIGTLQGTKIQPSPRHLNPTTFFSLLSYSLPSSLFTSLDTLPKLDEMKASVCWNRPKRQYCKTS